MTNNSDKAPTLPPAPLVAPPPMDRVEEGIVLQRSEELIFAQLAQPGLSASAQLARGFWQFSWSYGAGFAATAAFLFFTQTWWAPPTWTAQPLDYNKQSITVQQTGPTRLFRVANNQVGTIKQPGKWQADARPGSLFHIGHKHPTFTLVKLHRGGLRVHVIPKQSQHFEVRYQSARVLVKGTIFSVHGYRDRIRVEVFRGRVNVRCHGKTISLTSSQGIDLSLSTPTSRSSFSVPTTPSPTPVQRIQWYKKKSPKQLLGYGLFLLQRTDMAPRQKGTLILKIIDVLKAKRQWAHVQQLGQQAARALRQNSASHASIALFDAAVACYKQHRAHPTCQRLLQQCLRLPLKQDNKDLARRYLQLMRIQPNKRTTP